MTKLLATASVLALLALPAVAQTGTGAGGPAAPGASTTTNRSMDARGDATMRGDTSRSTRTASNTSVDKRDRDFARDAAKAGLAEVDEGKLAQQHSQNNDVQQFAKRMVDDHTQANEKLKSIAQAKAIDLPNDVDKGDKKSAQKLEKSKNFDRDYVSAEVKDHKKAVKLFEKEAKDGKDPELKQFAQETLPKLQEHLRMSQDLDERVRNTRTETSQLNRDRGTAGTSTAPATTGGATRTTR